MAATPIRDLDERHAAFYAPKFRVLVGGEDVLFTKHMEVASVQVESTLEGAARFTFTINNGFDLEYKSFRPDLSFFELGKSVCIAMGYEGRAQIKPLFTGMITSVTTSFPAAANPAIRVSGFDHSYPMTKGRGKQTWDEMTDSDVVRKIAKKHGLDPVVEDTKVKIAKIEQDESDLAFVRRLARRNGFEVYVRDKKLYFKPPSYGSDPTVKLEWRKGLRSFDISANLASTVTRVEVYGWDPKKKKEIVGVATKSDLEGVASDKASADHLAKLVGEDGVLKFRWPVYSKAEADQRAKAILKKHSEGFVVGDGESIGLPEIVIDSRIELVGMGPFDKAYYVESCTHTADVGGFSTRFRVKEVAL